MSTPTAPGPPLPPGPPVPPGPPAPADPQPAAPPTGMIRLTLQGSTIASGLVPPKVSLNGYQVPTGYGTNLLPVYAGRNHVDVEMQWLLTYGRAALDVDVAPGQAVDVWYAAPWHQFTQGAIGFQKQRRPGLGLFAGILVGAALVGLLIAVLALLGAR